MSNQVYEKMVSSVSVQGQEISLGREMNVGDAISELNNFGMGDVTGSGTPVVQDGVLHFQQSNGTKG